MPSVPEIITENIVKQLEQGVAPWRKPWSTSIPRNLISKKPYRGLNMFLLATQGYGSPYWLTFNQAGDSGGCRSVFQSDADHSSGMMAIRSPG